MSPVLPQASSETTVPNPLTAGLPKVRAWAPSSHDVSPGVKTRAVRLVEAAGTWAAGDGGVNKARARLVAGGYDPDLVDDLAPLLGDGVAAVTKVVVAQYGGILLDSASVLGVVDQWVLRGDGSIRAGGTTLDIRLIADEPEWTVTNVRRARPGRPVRALSQVARRLLDDDHVLLPHAAESDVRAGAINDSVLEALAMLAVDRRIDVSILRSGHPIRVFGTDRIEQSHRGAGRRYPGRSTVARSSTHGEQPAVADFMMAATEVGAYQVGGPIDPDGGGTVYFSDDTHQDHIHLGFAV